MSKDRWLSAREELEREEREEREDGKLADRIETLEAAMVDAVALIKVQDARIEKLEAALRRLIDNVETGSYESTGQAIDEARAALAPEQDK